MALVVHEVASRSEDEAISLASQVQRMLMSPVTIVMYMNVTVTAAVCNSSSDSDEDDMDAPEIIKKRKRRNYVVHYSQVILEY